EIRRAIEEIGRISALRLDQLVVADDRLKVHGRLSTHVLDNHAGKPAPGIPVELIELSAPGEDRVIARTVTNADGRTDQPLIGGRPLPIG
uniref:hydroxyisourate hydrolase n=1 Tax=Vibrio cholerae TaxID=666 RepID=UPI0018F08D78